MHVKAARNSLNVRETEALNILDRRTLTFQPTCAKPGTLAPVRESSAKRERRRVGKEEFCRQPFFSLTR